MPTPILQRPSAWIPLAMSLMALGLVVFHYLRFGITHETDEGAAAHLFQLLMAGQVPVIGIFGIKWLPRTPGPAVKVLALQGLAALAALASVLFLTGG